MQSSTRYIPLRNSVDSPWHMLLPLVRGKRISNCQVGFHHPYMNYNLLRLAAVGHTTIECTMSFHLNLILSREYEKEIGLAIANYSEPEKHLHSTKMSLGT